MCSRRRAVSSSHLVRRVITFRWWLMKYLRMLLRSSCWGLPSAMAVMFTPKVHWRSEYLNRAWRIFSGSASFFTSTTARMPCRSLSSRMSATPANTAFFSWVTARIFWRAAALLIP